MKFIWLGIYIFGICCRLQIMNNTFKRFRRYGIAIKKYLVISWVISIAMWPVYWLRYFINYYLDWDPEDFKK